MNSDKPPPPDPPGKSETTSGNEAGISNLPIPSFWSNRPDLWFLQIEMQFKLKKIQTSNVRYSYLVSFLPPEVMETVSDFLLNPPDDEKYEKLKQLLISRSQDTEEKRLDSLLNKIDLGNCRPSELFRQMKTVAGNNSLVNDKLLFKLWSNKLPKGIQSCVIAVEDKHTEEEILSIADKIFDATDHKHISQVDSRKCTQGPPSNFETHSSSLETNLSKALDEISSRLSRLEARGHSSRSHSHSHSNSHSRSRSKSSNRKSRYRKGGKYCFYHFNFGNNATKCTQPCQFRSSSKNENESKTDSKN